MRRLQSAFCHSLRWSYVRYSSRFLEQLVLHKSKENAYFIFVKRKNLTVQIVFDIAHFQSLPLLHSVFAVQFSAFAALPSLIILKSSFCSLVESAKTMALQSGTKQFNFACGYVCHKILLSSTFHKKRNSRNAPAEKVVDVVIAAAVSCLEMLVDHGRVALRRNVGVCAATVGLLDPRHILDDAHDLTCTDRRVRSAGVCLGIARSSTGTRQALRPAYGCLRGIPTL